jgi:hypothetical protein
MCRVDHVTREGRGKVYTGFWLGDLMEKDHIENLGAD